MEVRPPPRALATATRRHPLALLLSASLICVPLASQALEFKLGETGATLNWDTTVKYSAAFRLKNASDALINAEDHSGVNGDDGDRNFNKGLISNRFDLFTEADVKFGNFGARASAAAWYDSVYNTGNDNNSPATNNNFTVPYNEFTIATRNLAGRKAEFLDYFVFGKVDLGNVPLTFRAGNHTLYWGETFFFSNNGVAGTMGPIDAIKALQVPNSLAKEIFRPVGQVSAQLQFTTDIAFGAYYQYEWERTRIPPAGSFFGAADFFDAGGECFRFAAGPPCGTPGATVLRTADEEASNAGQFGLQLKARDAMPGVDFGAYATVSHNKTPYVYYHTALFPPGAPVPPGAPPFAITDYQLVFPEKIQTYGLSASFTSGDFQWAGEVSTRRNQPLAADGLVVLPGVVANNNSNPLYPVGNTAHVNLSVLATLPPNFIARQSSLIAELAWNRALSVTKNAAAVTPNATRDATSMRIVYTPTYPQLLDGLDLSVPMGVGYGIDGKSTAVQAFGGRGTGDFSVGLQGVYQTVWLFSLNYTQWFGPEGNAADAQGHAIFKQIYHDRNFISFSASTTF